MVDVAQLVRALDCGSRGRRFEPALPPKKLQVILGAFFVGKGLNPGKKQNNCTGICNLASAKLIPK